MPPAKPIVVRSSELRSNRLKEKVKSHGKRNSELMKKPNQDGFSNNFMDLDEFLERAKKAEKGNRKDEEELEDKDHAKPEVDLFASLLTLGKMVRDQKQFLDNQEQKSKQIDLKCPKENMQSEADNSMETIPSCESDMMCSDTLEDRNSRVDSCFSYSNPPESDEETSSFTTDSRRRATIPDALKDEDYWDRRRRNNLAAKKSRVERRKKEMEILKKASQLEQENSQLSAMLKRLTARNEILLARLQKVRVQERRDCETSISEES